MPYKELLALGVLPAIKGLYSWDQAGFDAVIISHAHMDHYGLLKYIHPEIPVYLSSGTETLIRVSQKFKIYDEFSHKARRFTMYVPFTIGNFAIKPFLMDHSAFDAAAFEITDGDKTLIYSGDFRGHGRKAICLQRFIEKAKKHADALLIEGTMFGRKDETVLTEHELEEMVLRKATGLNGPILFQASSQNLDRLVTFYRVAQRLKRIFVIDVYTANVLHELRLIGNNHLPFPSEYYPNIRVFFPQRLTQKIFHEVGEVYARRFSPYHISRKELNKIQKNIVMTVRPSMRRDLENSGLYSGLFLYSLWQGYRDNQYQKDFEDYLSREGFAIDMLHTSGHAVGADIHRVITELEPQLIIPIHTMQPQTFLNISEKVILKEDGVEFTI